MKMIPKQTFWVLAVVLIILILAVRHFQKTAHPKIPHVVAVLASEGSTSSKIIAEGSVLPVSIANVGLAQGVDGTIVGVNVDIGQHVTQGQILAEVDPEIPQENVERAQAALASAKAHYNLVVSPFRPEEIKQMQEKVSGDKDDVAEEQEKLNVLLRGSRPQEIAQSQSDVDAAKTQLELAKLTESRDEQLFNQHLIAQSDLDAAQTALNVAQDTYYKAEQELSLVQAGPRPEDIAEQQAALLQAQSTLGQDTQQYLIMMHGPRADDVQQAAAAVSSAQTDYNEAELMYQRCFVRAPVSGTVTARNIDVGDMAAANTQANYGQPQNTTSLFIIQGNDGVKFYANVDQMYYSKLYVGEPASVVVESIPGRTFSGQIAEIDPLINPAANQSGASTTTSVNPLTPFTFNVIVKVENRDHALVAGQIGEVTIQSASHGLLVPASAVTSFSIGYGTVYVVKDNVVNVRSVTYDETTDGQVRILTGLSPGEAVVVSQSSSLKDNQQVVAQVIPSDQLGYLPQAQSN